MSEVFDAALPQFIAIGMPYGVFWHSPVSAARAYAKAWKVRQDTANHDAYLQGAYFYEALLRVAPAFNAFVKNGKVQPWRDAPFDLKAQRDVDSTVTPLNEKQAKVRAYMENFMARQAVSRAAEAQRASRP